MTIYAQTRLEVAAAPQLHDRVRLALHSVVQRLEEAVANQDMSLVQELASDLKSQRDAWNQAIMVGGDAPTNMLADNFQDPADLYKPTTEPVGLTAPARSEAPALAPAPAAEGIVEPQAADHAEVPPEPATAAPRGRLFR